MSGSSAADGPIEFLGDVAAQKVGDTEIGGHDGLIQPELDPLGGPGHALSSSEASAVLDRAAGVPLVGAEQNSGVLATDNPLNGGTVVDPVTGRSVDADMNQDVTGSESGGTFSAMKP